MKYFAILFAFTLLLSCSTEWPDTYAGQASFYTTTIQGKWDLMIDTVNYGPIKELDYPVFCGLGWIDNIELEPGQYEYQLIRTDSNQIGERHIFTVTDGGCNLIHAIK